MTSLLVFVIFALFLLVPFVGFVWLVVFLVRANRKREAARTAEMTATAAGLGLTFFPQGNPAVRAAFADLPLFSKGYGQQVTNMIYGTADEVEIGIFDYQYTVSGGESSTTYWQTVMCLRSTNLAMPQFAMRPEQFFDRIGAALGFRDINFESHPGFSQKYLLKGKDEEAVRGLFRPEVLAYFEGQTGVSVEGSDSRLVYYRAMKRVPPAELRAFFEEGFRTYALFRAS